MSQITVASLAVPELPFHRARDEIWVELQILALSSAVPACPENHTGHIGTRVVHDLRESLQAD